MIRAAVTLVLFATGASATTATDTFTATLPTTTATETYTLPTGAETATETFTLPTSTASATETFTLPTATETFTLPTASGTETYTLPTATETSTATETFTLPTATATETFTLPTATETYTLPTADETFTLPTSTATSTNTDKSVPPPPPAAPVEVVQPSTSPPSSSPQSGHVVDPTTPAVVLDPATADKKITDAGKKDNFNTFTATPNTLPECNNLPCLTYAATADAVKGTSTAAYTKMSMAINLDLSVIEAGPGGVAGFKATFQKDVADSLAITKDQIPINGITLTATRRGRHARVLAGTKVDYTVCKESKSCIAAIAAATTDIGTLKAIGAPIQVDSDDEFPGWAIALCVVLPLLAIGGAAAAYFLLSGSGGDGDADVEGEEKPTGATEPAAEDIAEEAAGEDAAEENKEGGDGEV